MTHQPNSKPAEGNLVDQTREEHRGCMQLVSEIERCLDRRPDDPVSWVTDLRDGLSRLRTALKRHFDGEESGPMFRSLPVRHPRLAAQLAELEAEHPVMLASLDEVLDKARSLQRPELYQLRELNALTQLFVARVRRHEAAEDELVIQAYWDDVGTGD